MKYNLNLKEINMDSVEIQGTEMAIVDKETGEVFLTSRKYMDKLFGAAGYKNLNVVKILEEYAGKSVSSIGSVDPYKIYVNDLTGTFIFASDPMISWVNAMVKFFEEGKFTFSHTKSDVYYMWDQLVVTNQVGGKYIVYVDFLDEAVYVYSTSTSDDDILIGFLSEGKFKFSEGQESFDRFKLLVSSSPRIDNYFRRDIQLSFYEYIELLKSLGYVHTKKHKVYSTERSTEVSDIVEGLDDMLDKYNEMSWLQTRINPAPNSATFFDGCKLINRNLHEDHYFSDFEWYYKRNKDETSDMFALKF